MRDNPSYAWWQRGVLYQIYPRSFQDSNGDGVGDLRGIIARLDYLADLGIDAIWLSPIYPSPMADFGYDVSNYIDIDARFGTLADFDALMAAATKRGLKSSSTSCPIIRRINIRGLSKAAGIAPIPNAIGTSGAIRRRTAARPTTGCLNSAARPGHSIRPLASPTTTPISPRSRT
jgi:hypothetical protein